MEQIRSGSHLKHVSSEDRARAPPLDTRDELLGQIRTGVTLRRVDPDILHQQQQQHEIEAAAAQVSGIAGMLQKALQERSGVMRFSSSEDEDEAAGDDDDEWDD